MPFSEFLEWLEFLRQEERRHSKQDWYQAQIAAECRRSFVESPNKVKVTDFLLVEQTVDPEAQERGKKSKAAWAAFLQVDVKGKQN